MPSSPPSARLSLDRTVNDQRRLTKAALRFDDNIEVQPSRFDTDRRDLRRANIYLSIKRSLWSFQFAVLAYS
jgi:hypothetical protein